MRAHSPQQLPSAIGGPLGSFVRYRVSMIRQLALAIVLAGCNGNAPPAGTAAAVDDMPTAEPAEAPLEAPEPLPAERAEPGPPSGGVDGLPHLHGRTRDFVHAELGPPDAHEEFNMADGCHGARAALFRHYERAGGENPNVVIREDSWRYDGYGLRVWFHLVEEQWLALDTVRASDTVDF